MLLMRNDVWCYCSHIGISALCHSPVPRVCVCVSVSVCVTPEGHMETPHRFETLQHAMICTLCGQREESTNVIKEKQR